MASKSALAAALFLGLATASQVPKECFAQSRQAFGDSEGQTKFSHEYELQTNGNFNKDTRVSQITACKDLTGRLSRLQVTLKDFVTQKVQRLASLGGSEQVDEKCSSINLNAGDLITSIIISHDSRGVARVSLVWQKSGSLSPFTTSVGNQTQEIDSILFNSASQLVGFYGESSAGVNIQNLGALVYNPACGANTQEADVISMQFIALNLSSTTTQLVDTSSKEKEPTPVFDDKGHLDDKSTTIIIAVVVPVAVLIMILVACILVCRLKKRNFKNNSVETEKSIKITENAETPRRFFPEGDDDCEAQEYNGEGRIRLRDRLPFNNEINVDEQHDVLQSICASPNQKHRQGDVDNSTPEETHPPQRTTGRAIILKVEEDCTGIITNRDSFCPGPDIVDIREDSQHPDFCIIAYHEPEEESHQQPAFMVYHEEESSMPALKLDSKDSSAQKQVVDEAGMLPKIGRSIGQQLFMDTTPDTAGVAQRRFQEIIDSDDETNGNGSRIQRFKKKFQNTRDVFGEESSKAIHSTEKEYTEKGAIKKSTEAHFGSFESIESQKKSRHLISLESQKSQEDGLSLRRTTKNQSGQQKKKTAPAKGVKK